MKYTFAIALLVALVDGKKLTQKAAVHAKAKGDEFYTPFEKGMLGAKEYKRVIPARFSADSDDILMRSVLQNYAQEGATKDGTPTGVFTLSEASAHALAEEVLATHKNIRGADQVKYLDTYWAKAWGYFDVNRTGRIPYLYAAGLMRFLMSDQYISL